MADRKIKLINLKSNYFRDTTILIFLKGIGVLAGIMIVPLSLEILGSHDYGLWITVFNVISWITILDLGIGNSLRNIFTEKISKGSINSAREYLGLSYKTSGIISFILAILIFSISPIIKWHKIFNVEENWNNDLSTLVITVATLTLVHLTIKLIDIVFLSIHRPHLSAINSTLSNISILTFFFFSRDNPNINIITFGLVFCGVPVAITLLSSIFAYNTIIKDYSPKWKQITLNSSRKFYVIGGKFFLIQISMLVLFSTDNLIITLRLSPEEVTPYNIALRYFGVISTLTNLILLPLWSIYTQSAATNNIDRIKKILKYQLIGMTILTIIIFFYLKLANQILPLWIGNNIVLSNKLLIGFVSFTIISCWNNIFSNVLGALSILRVGTVLTIASAIINIPLSIFLLRVFGNDTAGIIIATSICLGVTSIISPIQVYLLLFSTEKNKIVKFLLR
jgi:O-antigen/teichoic acid export membrane protein